MTLTEIQSHLKQETKYGKLYLSIINNAQNENRKKLKKSEDEYIYFENHHILPESMFPEYGDLRSNKWNSILLTAREHFICHILIWKHYKSISYTYGERKMSKAIRRMNGSGKYNSKHYETYNLNLSHSEETKNKMRKVKAGVGNPMYNQIHSDCTKKQMSDSAKNREIHPCLGKKHSEERKEKQSKLMKKLYADGVIISSKPFLDKEHSDCTKKQMSDSAKNRETVTCPHCNKSGKINGMKQWHFDKCKHK